MAVSFSSKVPWVRLLREDPQDRTSSESVVLCKRGASLLRVYGVEGIDDLGDDPATIGARMLRANRALQRLVGKWTLHSEAQRVRFTAYPQRPSRFAVAAMADAEHRARLTHPQTGLWDTTYVMSLTWEPGQGQRRVRQRFRLAADDFMEHLGSVLAKVGVLAGDDLVSTLKSTVSFRWQRVGMPSPGADLSHYLVDSGWSAGRYPEWDATCGPTHVRMLSLTGYPRHSRAGMMERLEMLRVPYRWSVRWRGFEPHKQDPLLYELQKDNLAEEKTLGQRTVERLSRHETRLIREAAVRRTEDLGTAMQDTAAGVYGMGEFSTTLITWAETADQVEMHAQHIRHTLEGLGFVVRKEGDYGARSSTGTWILSKLVPPHHTAVFLGAMPGNTEDGRRWAYNSTQAVTHLLPGLRTVWAGPSWDTHLHQPPWLYDATATGSVTRICHYVRGVGHAFYLGNTGSGKSTRLGWQMLQWLLYPHTRGRILDVGRSQRLMTLLTGGLWVDLGAANIGLQPLRYLDDPAQFRWCREWLVTICERAGIVETHGLVAAYLTKRLRELLPLRAEARTMSQLVACCERHLARVEPNAFKRRNAEGLATPDERMLGQHDIYRAIGRALRPFTRLGEYGGILDGVQADVLTSHLVTFEHASMAKTPRLLAAVSEYLFHSIEQGLDTRHPTWIVAEEAPLLATLPQYAETFDLWLMTLRKEGGSLGMVINSLEQAQRLRLTNENTPTRWLFPNKEAQAPEIRDIYRRLGLSEAEILVIATADAPYQCLYVARERGRRLVELRLGPLAFDCVGRNTDEDHEAMDKLVEQYGAEDFPRAWLAHHGHTWEA